MLGVNFGDGVYRYPTQLYELVFDMGLFALFLYLKKNKQLAPGTLFRYLLNAYLLFRFFLEFIRESDRIAFGISYYQMICLFCIVFINIKKIIAVIRRKQTIAEYQK
jgi:prolipoprotein diacylglyceryltransferase